MQTQEMSLELISKEPETNGEGVRPIDGQANPRIERENISQGNNLNNNRLGEFSQSTEPVDRNKRPSVLSNASFLLAIIDVILASVCTWYWYSWVWFIAVPAFVGGLIALTCSDNPKMSFLWAVLSLILSLFCIAWSAALLAICFQMCTCNYFGEKKIAYDQMAYHGDSDDEMVPCVYITFPPFPVPKSKLDSFSYCFQSPIATALFGFGNGYEANPCQRPPRKMCRKFDWFEARRQEERKGGVWAWKNGRNVFMGVRDVKVGDQCHLDSDCMMFPKNLCFGDDTQRSICTNGTKVELGGWCSFDDQCQQGMDYQCNYDKNLCATPPEIEVKCIDHMCLARSTCPDPDSLENRFASGQSGGLDFCQNECSCCSGCDYAGQCLRGSGTWECDCKRGSFGPNCKYNTDTESKDVPGAIPGQKGLCTYMSKICNGGKCEPSYSEHSGFRCICKAGASGQYCTQ